MPFIPLLLGFVRALSPRTWLIIGGVAAVLFLGRHVYHLGYDACLAATMTSTLEIKEKQNEIAVNRPDTDTLFNSLRNGSY